MLAWMQINTKESTHVQLSEFQRKSGKDIVAWYEEVDRIATVNN